jgi:oligopeptide/dipeptide ABC transporter ATP-binding protein
VSLDSTPLLSVDGLHTHFPVSTGLLGSIRFDRESGGFPLKRDERAVRAVDGVSFDLHPGETLGVVGESGCGKSTLARTILGLETATDGEIRFDGRPVDEIPEGEFRARTQMVFQDPQSSLNGRRKVGEIVADPLEGAGWSKSERKERALTLLEQVGLKREYYNRYPHEFSGGQRQRINLARALSINPDLVVCDEPVSGLDVSVQAQILNLMDDLQREYGLTYLFISHDLSVVRYVADRIAVMYLGEFVEFAPTEALFSEPAHPYSTALLGSVPNPDPDTPGVDSEIIGDVPSAQNPPRGCRFHTRCPAFILPDGFTETAYWGFESLLVDVRERSVDPDQGADALVTSYLGEASLPTDARGAVDEALSHAGSGDWDRAEAVLEPFESVCQRERPPLFATDDRLTACHLVGGEDDGER